MRGAYGSAGAPWQLAVVACVPQLERGTLPVTSKIHLAAALCGCCAVQTRRKWLATIGFLGFLAASWCVTSSASMAGDWPGILGPTRDGVSDGEKLVEKWPAAGPKKLWAAELGSGYAGPAVVGDKVIVFHRLEGVERIESLDARNGRSIWKADFEATYRGGIDSDLGPRCVPVVSGNTVIAFGAAGDLYAVDLQTGAKLWSQSLYEEFGADEGYFGAGSTPIVLEGRVLVNVGGRGAGIVACDLKTGAIVWKATDYEASYASPTSMVIQNKPYAIFITRLDTVLVDPTSGKVQELAPFGRPGPTVNAAVPLVVGNRLFLTSSYGVGAVALDLQTANPAAVKTKQVWASDDALSSQYATPVVVDGYLYGTHGREDGAPGELRCVELATGKVRWSSKDFGIAHVVRAGDKLLVLTVDGRLFLLRANPEKLELLEGADLTAAAVNGAARKPADLLALGRGRSTRGTRPLPALSAGVLYVRTHTGEPTTMLYGYQVGE